jgi:hypothetical protein
VTGDLALYAAVGTFLLGAAFCMAQVEAVSPKATLRNIAASRAGHGTELLPSRNVVYAFQPDTKADQPLHILTSGRSAVVSPSVPVGGELRAVAPLGRDDLLLYVAATGRSSVGGIYRVAAGAGAGEPRRVIDTATVERASGMGTLLALADVQMVGAGGDVWLILRHPDQTAFCRFDVAQFLAGTPRLGRPFERVTVDGQAIGIDPGDRWTGRADGGLDLFRPTTGESWRVDAFGRASPLVTLSEDRPRPTAPPLTLGRGTSRVLQFFPKPPPSATAAEEAVRYPALVISDGATERVIESDAIDVRPGFPVHALRITAWCVEPLTGDVIAYDAMSGEVFRLTFSE